MAKSLTKLASRQTAYLLWFEFLKLAIKSNDKKVKANLLKTSDFYQPWGIEKAADFRLWWKDHGHLFEEKYFVRRMKNGEPPLDKNALIVEIPLTQSPTKLIKSVRLLISDALNAQNRVSKKRKGLFTASYSISEYSEPKLVALSHTLAIYRDVFLKNKTLRGTKLLKAIHSYYLTRKKRGKNTIPPQFIFKDGDEESQRRALRNARRYIQRAENIILNVSNGFFPGKY